MLKSISSLLLISQLSLAVAGAQLTYAAPPATPEMQLLQTIITLQGQDLSKDQLQGRLKDALSTYRTEASPDPQGERMQQALVAMNIFTSEQAQSYWTEVQNQTAGIANQQVTVSQALTNLISTAPAGAQFSAVCGTALVGFLGGVAVLSLIGESGSFVGPSSEVGFGIEMGAVGALGIGLLVILAEGNSCV